MKHFPSYLPYLTALCLLSGLPGHFEACAQSLEKGPPQIHGTAPSTANAASPTGGATTTTVTTISSKKGAFLDSKACVATFTGEVTVVDPRFSLTCDKLTAFFVRPSTETKAKGELKGEPETSRNSGLDKAEAEGDVVIIQDKVGEKGEVERSLARAQKAVYDSQTGNITLSGWPQVEQKQNVTMAAEENTVIILNRKGKLEVLGHSKSILRNASMSDGR
jgi:lipopolysaccharide export system protein LptA